MRRRFLLAGLLPTLLVLSACGGGGGGGGTPLPAAPAAVRALADDQAVAVTWTPVNGATSYNVYLGTTSSVSKTTGTKHTGVALPFVKTGLSNGTTYYFVVTAVNSAGESAESAVASAAPAAPAADPLYSLQWHLKNEIQAGEDAHVEAAWAQTCGATSCRGDNVRIVVVDDGLEIGHEDLAFSVEPDASYNYVTGTVDPTPADTTSYHGTAVAGVAAARDHNGLGVRGVAPRARLAGYNVLQNSTLANKADAATRNSAAVAVSSNSWGPPDGTGQLSDPTQTWRDAILAGLASGRGGKGTVYTWAAGNGHQDGDNSNYDGQANFRGVIAVAAVMDDGTKASYSERGANLWVSAPAGDFCNNSRTTVTTDLSGAAGMNNNGTSADGYPFELADGDYTMCFNGTSSATPVVSGVVALMLQANPDLSWRDVRLILAETARHNDPSNSDDGLGWQTGAAKVSGGNYRFHHNYGFGVVDADAAVALAKTWTNVGPQLTPCQASRNNVNIAIPDDGPVVQDQVSVSGCGIGKIEFIEITFTSNHTYAGDLTIALVSPSGVWSILAETHVCNDGSAVVACDPGYSGWVFGSAAHLGEAANGTWTLRVLDGAADDTGSIGSWSLKFYGRAS